PSFLRSSSSSAAKDGSVSVSSIGFSNPSRVHSPSVPSYHANRNACFAQTPRHSFGNLRRAGSVAVNADGLGVHANFAAVAGDHYASLRDAQGLPRRLLGIEDQRIIKLARPQSSIWLIPPVGERFGGQRETCFAKNVQHRRARESNQYDFP